MLGICSLLSRSILLCISNIHVVMVPKPNSVVRENTGFLFGGLYSDRTDNFLTRSKSCPQYFNPLRIALNIRVCISDDFELGTKSSVPFGGFYSCQNGNPLVNGKFQKSCPKGFSNHLAFIGNDCEIQYCLRTAAGQPSDLKFQTVQLPPFPTFRQKVLMKQQTTLFHIVLNLGFNSLILK